MTCHKFAYGYEGCSTLKVVERNMNMHFINHSTMKCYYSIIIHYTVKNRKESSSIVSVGEFLHQVLWFEFYTSDPQTWQWVLMANRILVPESQAKPPGQTWSNTKIQSRDVPC